MSYQVLARKWRPRNFAEVMGQQHVVRALVNGLDDDRLHHGFLFTGTRGVGKTTIARILAKCLNCEKGVSSKPCGECGACVEIDEGRFVDLIEVDAASRTKVEDTRELLENVQYAPTRGRYKVYLIDEVHMLSMHSFNALLKTLEEPPPHVKFLLATTDPQKIPVTILSRCLQFNLKLLPVEQIVEYLTRILGEEGVKGDGEAIERIAQAADGSMRDALSLLDQAIAYCGGELRNDDVQEMLGTLDQSRVLELLTRVAEGDAGRVLETVETLAEYAPDYATVTQDLARLLHRIAVAQFVAGGDQPKELQALAENLSPESVQLYYEIATRGTAALRDAPDGRTGLEMTLLRMIAFRPDEGGSTQSHGTQVPAGQQKTKVNAPSAAAGDENWEKTVDKLAVRGAARELAANCVLKQRSGNRLELLLPDAHASLRTPTAEQRLQEALTERYGEKIRLVITVGDGETESPAAKQNRQRDERYRKSEKTLSSDPEVRALQETFGAEIVPGSIQPPTKD